MRMFWCAAFLMCCLLRPALVAGQMPHYDESRSLHGSIRSAGSDTLRILLEKWFDAYQKQHPQASAEIESLGSATAPPALLAGACDVAAMSREMTSEEVSRFKRKFGYDPVDVHVALDAVAVVVHPSNPVEGLTLQQLDGVFSSTRKCGGKDITRWDQLFLGPVRQPNIKLYGRNSLSGTSAFFRETALCGGDYRSHLQQLPDSDDIEAAVEQDPAGIGYSGLGYRTSKVKVLAIARNANSAYRKYYVEQFQNNDDLEKRYAWVYRGDYPLTRVLRFYVNKPEGEALPDPLDDFLRFVLSAKGQAIVHQVGYIPLTEKMVRQEREKLEPDYRPRWRIF